MTLFIFLLFSTLYDFPIVLLFLFVVFGNFFVFLLHSGHNLQEGGDLFCLVHCCIPSM